MQSPGQVSRITWTWLIIIGAELAAWACLALAAFVWIDARGLWCAFFPYLPGCG